MSTAGLAPLLVALGIARCARDSAARRVGNTAGTAFAAAYVTYMVVFHLLANLPLDQVRKPSTLDPQASAPNPAFETLNAAPRLRPASLPGRTRALLDAGPPHRLWLARARCRSRPARHLQVRSSSAPACVASAQACVASLTYRHALIISLNLP